MVFEARVGRMGHIEWVCMHWGAAVAKNTTQHGQKYLETPFSAFLLSKAGSTWHPSRRHMA